MNSRLEGWPLVGWAALGIGAMTAAVLVSAGTGEEGLRMLIRATARTSIVFFFLAFTASSLRRLWRHEASAWLLRNRRQLGVSYAISHFVHLAAIVEAAIRFPDFRSQVGWIAIVFGGLAYVFLAAMTATSFDRPTAWLGRRRWHQLHLLGSWYFWVVFVQSYLPRALEDPRYVPAAALILAMPALRIAARMQSRERATSPA